jgi:hypothetical protein
MLIADFRGGLWLWQCISAPDGGLRVAVDRLASWKSREYKGVIVHGLIVLAVTWMRAVVRRRLAAVGAVHLGDTHRRRRNPAAR